LTNGRESAPASFADPLDVASRPLRRLGAGEYLPIESIEGAGRREEAEPASSFPADDNANRLTLRIFHCIAFGHGSSVRRERATPLLIELSD